MASNDHVILIDNLRYADPEKYHPHDALMYKYYPAEHIASLQSLHALYNGRTSSQRMREKLVNEE
jgi:hypothetical protein